MKTSPFFIVVVASLLPTLTTAQAALHWSVTDPESALYDITFPMYIGNAPHQTGYYFAQQFTFGGAGGVGYTGLQPRPDYGGDAPIINAVFSSFTDGATTDDPQCHSGADGGPGVSCAVEFNGDYSHIYHLEIRNTGGTTWEGTCVDTVNLSRIHIGSFTLPTDSGPIDPSGQQGFVEYYWFSECSSIPWTSVEFGLPMTSAGGTGVLLDPYESGGCVGEGNFESHRTEEGNIEISFGFSFGFNSPYQLHLQGF